jgi:hypothetical protein
VWFSFHHNSNGNVFRSDRHLASFAPDARRKALTSSCKVVVKIVPCKREWIRRDYLSMVLQSFVGPWPLFQFLNPIHSW